MSAELVRPSGMNTIAFPTALSDAIPDLPTCVGRVLKLDAISGGPSFGNRVQLNLVAQETGNLTGEFTVRIDLDPQAAAETLLKLVSRH